MKNKMIFRCFAYRNRKDNFYYACCIDLNLVDRGESMDDVIKKLEDNIVGYLQTTFEELEGTKHLIPRKAPFSYRLQYRLFNIKLSIRRFNNA